MTTPRLQSAITFARSIHQDNPRKLQINPRTEYDHVFGVLTILHSVTNDEDTLIAGVLHDTIEDCAPYGSVTEDTLTEQFGETVANYVAILSDDKNLSWGERKAQSINKSLTYSHPVALIKTADIIDNLSDLVPTYEKIGEKVFDYFSGTKEDTIYRKKITIENLEKNWPGNPLLPEAKRLLSKLPAIQTEYRPDWLQ